MLLAPTPAPALFRQSVGLPLRLLFGDSSLPGGGTLSGTEWAPDPPETTLQGQQCTQHRAMVHSCHLWNPEPSQGKMGAGRHSQVREVTLSCVGRWRVRGGRGRSQYEGVWWKGTLSPPLGRAAAASNPFGSSPGGSSPRQPHPPHAGQEVLRDTSLFGLKLHSPR